MLRRVAVVRNDVSEEFSASIRVTRIGELGTTLAVTNNGRTRRNIPEDTILHSFEGLRKITNSRESASVRVTHPVQVKAWGSDEV
jgi:hypothetical protein